MSQFNQEVARRKWEREIEKPNAAKSGAGLTERPGPRLARRKRHDPGRGLLHKQPENCKATENTERNFLHYFLGFCSFGNLFPRVQAVPINIKGFVKSLAAPMFFILPLRHYHQVLRNTSFIKLMNQRT